MKQEAPPVAADSIPTKTASQTEEPETFNEVLIASLPALIPLVLSILAASLYALMRNGYVRFYGQYGINPEDVGLGQQHLVAGAVRFCLAGTFLRSYTVIKLVIMFTALVVVWGLVARFCMKSGKLKRYFPVNWKRMLAAAFIYITLLTLGFLVSALLVLPRDRQFAWDRIQNTRAVGPNDLAFLMVQASPASVTWMASKESTPPVGFPTASEPVVYLGHDDKMVVIYVPRTSSTWRVPEEQALVQITRQ